MGVSCPLVAFWLTTRAPRLVPQHFLSPLSLPLSGGEEGEGWPSKNYISLEDTNCANKEDSTGPGTILATGGQRPARQISIEVKGWEEGLNYGYGKIEHVLYRDVLRVPWEQRGSSINPTRWETAKWGNKCRNKSINHSFSMPDTVTDDIVRPTGAPHSGASPYPKSWRTCRNVPAKDPQANPAGRRSLCCEQRGEVASGWRSEHELEGTAIVQARCTVEKGTYWWYI